MSYVYIDVVREDILRLIPQDGKVIGSFGCGRAATEAKLVEAGREVHGVDISEEAIGVAGPRLTTARRIAPDDRDCFQPNSLDGLILADVLEHLPLAWESLKQLAVAVRPGGWVAISVPNMRSIKVFKDFMIGGDWPEHETGLYDRTHIQVMSPKRLERWCDAAGLTPEQWFITPLGGGAVLTFLRLIDRLTFGLFHNWFGLQIQLRARKR